MSYNILCGGSGPGGERTARILDLVARQRPDFVALQEANRFAPDEANRLAEFSARLGLAYTALARAPRYADGQRYHVASLSRYPIVDAADFPAGTFQSAALMTTIDSPLGPLGIVNVHLHDESEDARLAEIEQVLGAAQRPRPSIVMGDLNAISRADVGDESRLQCEARYEVTERLRQAYVDLFAGSAEPTHPSAISVDARFTRPRRIDYCFVSPRLASRVTLRRVISDDLANRASDHFPLVIDLDNDPGESNVQSAAMPTRSGKAG